ncbi:MAG: hypothetical protein M1820_009209 [Bogoriella megaspora]|nr:MAG: hypothetical protein M1820_009209 [Bogoriella megaspora]
MSLFGKNPNGLTINTGGGPSGGSSLFGNNTSTGQSQQQGGGLFGSAPSSQPAQGGSLFGTTTNTSQPQQGGGLFGSNTSQPQQGGGLFGSATSQPQQAGTMFGSSAAQPQQGGGLFGSNTGNQQQNTSLSGSTPFSSNTGSQAAGGLFGNQQNQNQNQNQNQSGGLFANLGKQTAPPQNNSLFGTSNTFGSQQQSQPQQATSLFGGLGQQQQQQQQQNQTQPARSLFGGSTLGQPQNQQQQPQAPSTAFGTLGAAGRAATTSLFGSSTNAPNRGMLPPLTMGQSTTAQPGPAQPQAPSTVPGVRIDLTQMRGTTRFNDLHQEVQTMIEKIDNFIAQQVSFAEQCSQIMPNHSEQLNYIANDSGYVSERADQVELGLDHASRETQTLKQIISKDGDDAKRAFRVLENLKLPVQFHYTGMWSANYPRIGTSGADPTTGVVDPTEEATENADLTAYFEVVVDRMTKVLSEYNQNMKEIEEHLRAVEASAVRKTKEIMAAKGRATGENGQSGKSVKQEHFAELGGVLAEFENGILNVAARVGENRAKIQELVLADAGVGRASNPVSRYAGGWGRLSGYARS